MMNCRKSIHSQPQNRGLQGADGARLCSILPKEPRALAWVVGSIIGFLFLLLCNAGYPEEPHVYDSGGKRDPFVPLVGIEAEAAGTLADIVNIEGINLQGIAGDSKGKKIAIINGETLKEGETVGHITIVKILDNMVVLTIDGEEYKVPIYEEKLR